MVYLIKEAVLLGIGALDKSKELVRDFKRRGEANQGPIAKLAREVMDKAEAAYRDCLQAALDRAGVATKADLQRLEERLQGSRPRKT